MLNSKTSTGSIMLVDDNPTNLKLLEDMLRVQGYEVRSFPRGRMALAAAQQQPPELILLDINMPEMNGYEVCERLKANPALADIPVIFLSALNATEDKVKGFRTGGADFVSKPFQLEEVQARVETHIRLRRAMRAERELLEKTIGGAMWTLLELVQITSPVLVLRTQSIRDIVMWTAKRMGLADAWQYELAAMLCLVGCIVMPDEIFERAYGGQELTEDEAMTFRAHPEIAADLLSNIPRLETVAEIIRRQQAPELAVTDTARRGAQLLQLALELDRRLYLDLECGVAVGLLRKSGQFETGMVDALDNYVPSKAAFETRQLAIRDLRSAMVIDEDIVAVKSKMLILREGMVLNPMWIERLGNFARSIGVQERVRVRVPRFVGANLGMLAKLGAAVPAGKVSH